MNKPILHIIVDPLCGWTYGAIPLIRIADCYDRLRIKIHCAGLFIGEQKREISPEFRENILVHDKKISERTHQYFGTKYTNGLLKKSGFVLNSEPAITALLAINNLNGSASTLLEAIQTAYYLNGEDITQLPVLMDLAKKMRVNAYAFETEFNHLSGESTLNHIEKSRELLNSIDMSGLPSSVLELENNKYTPLNISDFYGDIWGWVSELKKHINTDAVNVCSNKEGAFAR